jgi:hypothetical protein
MAGFEDLFSPGEEMGEENLVQQAIPLRIEADRMENWIEEKNRSSVGFL